MRATVFSGLLLSLVFAIGCHRPGALSSETTQSDDASTDATQGLSVPRLEPKPVVWIEDWQETEADEPPSARTEAQGLLAMADLLKSAERFAEAEDYYQQAMQADPTWAYPAYQLACNYELWDRHEQATPQFAKAVELGFDDFPTALVDDELGQLRDAPGFRDALVTIRERYLASSAARVGQPIAVRPQEAAPPDGWPLMLLLHGYGDTNTSYLDEAQAWAALGFVAVAVPGSVPSGEGRFQWSADSTDPTDQDLRAIIESPKFAGLVNRQQAFVLGFSQGALHAMLIAAEHPNTYAGVVALSPGGSLARRLADPPLNRDERAARCAFIHGEQEPHAPYVEIWDIACSKAGWKFYTATHPGGHQFPDNWPELQPEIATFLTP